MLRQKKILEVIISVMVFGIFAGCAGTAPAEQERAQQRRRRRPQKLTYEDAVKMIPADRKLPDWWFGDVKGLTERFEKLKKGKFRTITVTPGGRGLHLITYGEFEKVKQLANFNSAVGAREPGCYMDKAGREKPVVYFVGPVHGHEVEALTGLVNFINVMETGRDLRGKEQAELKALGEKCRLLILPAGNPDGIARFEPRALQGMEFVSIPFWGQGTWSDDSLCGWPRGKRQHPMVGDNVGFMGCYFNDIGINPIHDELFDPMSTEAPAIMKVAKEEGPDMAISFHSHSSPPTLLRTAYVPLEVQQDVLSLAEKCYAEYAKRDLPYGRTFTAKAEGGENPDPFNLTCALYHISGATSFTFECPQGVSGGRACQVTLDQILDIQLTLYEMILRHELDKKARSKQVPAGS